MNRKASSSQQYKINDIFAMRGALIMIYIEQVKKDIFLISMDIETFTNYGIDINQFLDDDIDGVYKEGTIELDNNDDSNLYQVLNSFTTNINDIFHINNIIIIKFYVFIN